MKFSSGAGVSSDSSETFIGCAESPSGKVTGSVTEICGRDLLNLVLRIGNSNEIPLVGSGLL
jgi:hypothetical protein